MNEKSARCTQVGLTPSIPVTWFVCSPYSRRMSFFSPPARLRSAGRDFRPTSWPPTNRCDLLHQRVGRGRCCRRGRLHAEPGRTIRDPARRREGGTARRASHDGISQAARRSLASVPRCPHSVRRGLTRRCSQQPLASAFWALT